MTEHTPTSIASCLVLRLYAVAGQLTSTALMLGNVLFPESRGEKNTKVYLFHTPALRGMLKRCSEASSFWLPGRTSV